MKTFYLVKDGAGKDTCIVSVKVTGWSIGITCDLSYRVLGRMWQTVLADEWAGTRRGAIACAALRHNQRVARARELLPAGARIICPFNPKFVTHNQWERRAR